MTGSCDDYLKSYHNMTDEEFKYQEKTSLISNFVGTFSTRLADFPIDEISIASNNVFSLVFKNTFSFTARVQMPLRDNFISHNTFTLTDADSLEMTDLNAEGHKLVAFKIYRISIESFLHKVIFKKINFILIDGTFNQIKDEKFLKELTSLNIF